MQTITVSCDTAINASSNVDNVMLLWSDPPYGTGKVMASGDNSYKDHVDNTYVVDSIVAWIPKMNDNGTIAICCDYRLAADMVIGVTKAGWVYRGEIIWEFALGRPRTTWWPVRHNNILTFTKTETSGVFNESAVPRQKRLAPGKGYNDPTKRAGSVWEFTMSNTDPQRLGYPNQKPVELVTPFILAHTNLGDTVADPFAGSGTVGEIAQRYGRNVFLNDVNPQAIETIKQRLQQTPK